MKKSQERHHLLRFREICSIFPNGEIEESEAPDFIVRTNKGTIGIEHTEIFQPGPSHGGSLQAQDSLAQKIVKKAKDIYDHNYSQSLNVQILFNPNVRIDKRNILLVAEKVAHLVGKNLIAVGDFVTLRRTREVEMFFPEEIALVHIFRYRESVESDWFCSSAGRIARIDKDYLQAVISRKEHKLDSFTPCEEVWLLIVADEARIPSTVDLDDLTIKYHYMTRFDRVFFFWNATRRCVELQVTS